MPAMEGPTLRGRLAGGGCKPPQGASVKSRGAERCGKGGQPVRQVWARKTSVSEPLMTCRNNERHRNQACEVRLGRSPGDTCLLPERCPAWRRREPGRALAGNMGTCRLGTDLQSKWAWSPWRRERGPQAAGTARGRVAARGTGTDRLVVAMKACNAAGAKGTGHPGLDGGQPRVRGGARNKTKRGRQNRLIFPNGSYGTSMSSGPIKGLLASMVSRSQHSRLTAGQPL